MNTSCPVLHHCRQALRGGQGKNQSAQAIVVPAFRLNTQQDLHSLSFKMQFYKYNFNTLPRLKLNCAAEQE